MYIEDEAMSEDVTDGFIEGLRQLGLTGQGASLYAPFLRYRQELLDWNTRTNLTAITDPDDVLIKHFLDSLSLLQAYGRGDVVGTGPSPVRAAPTATVFAGYDGQGKALSLLDIGSGAGFPGLPLKIVRPDWRVTLLEATGKKTAFLQHMIKVLALEGIEVIHGRAEELAHNKKYRAAFDVVTARAVSSLPILLEYCAPFCRVGGSILLPKKGDLTGELEQGKRATVLVGATFRADVAVDLPGLHDGRRILVWQQQRACPAIYPRSGAAMAKRPLG
jgi:16S rRNA (guanine527-N7)-methyltransferase